ncbi:hypothetical protein D3C87_1892230 [compost metagenome]
MVRLFHLRLYRHLFCGFVFSQRGYNHPVARDRRRVRRGLFHAPSRRLDFRLDCRYPRPQGLDDHLGVHDVRRLAADRRHADL